MRRIRPYRYCATLAMAMAVALVGGCGALQPKASPHSSSHSLAGARSGAAAPPSAGTGPTLMVSPPHAAAGFDSPRIMYVRKAGQLEYFAYNEWVDTPARMLAPLVVAAIGGSGAFRAVVGTPSAATGELRLDTEILRLQHEFLGSPSQVRFTMRAYLVESATRRVIDSRDFEAVIPAASEDPLGGVAAASHAVQTVLVDLTTFCAEAARNRR